MIERVNFFRHLPIRLFLPSAAFVTISPIFHIPI